MSYRIKEIGGITIKETSYPIKSRKLDAPELAYNLFKEIIEDSPRFTPSVENFMILTVNTRRNLISFQIISTGTLDTLLVHPREVFRGAIVDNASALILMHNHPSGDTSPSEADIRVTRDLIRAGQILKIEVLDHIIVGESFTSLRELGYFYS